MNVWSSNFNTTQMANNLIKWWRTKFLNGYKPFIVDCKDGKVSDTEELLGRESPNYSSTPLLEQINEETTLPLNCRQNDQHLNLQEFSCDVSVEGGVNTKNTQKRQEFSFTLYDFDGHGKITKDDIAGLVTTIYEALGSSVKVPHYGSKTIKVKLTVSPDQRKHVSATLIGHKDVTSDEKPQESSIKIKQDGTTKQSSDKNKKHTSGNHRKEHKRKHYCCRKLEENETGADLSDVTSDVCSRVSSDVTSEDDEKAFYENRRCQGLHSARYEKYFTSNCNKPDRCSKETNVTNPKHSFLRPKKFKKRSSLLQRQELLDIIQTNMDKYNTSFQNSRKPEHISTESNQLLQNDVYRNRHKVPTLQYLTNPTNFYVDLASLQNSTQFSQTNCQYDKLVDAVIQVTNKQIMENKSESCKRHHRSKSHDLSNTSQLLLDQPTGENVNKSSRKPQRKSGDSEHAKKNIQKFPQVVLGHTSSPHHLRHRNRQEDQARAMAQVVRWLEQEFSTNLHTSDNKEKVNLNYWLEGDHSSSTTATPISVTERHEHHHVHEHIHHHYHHYQENPVV